MKDGQGVIVNFFLAVGGEMCIIKILNCLKREVYSVFLSIAAHLQTLEGHAGIIKALRSFHNNSYLLLSVTASLPPRSLGKHRRIDSSVGHPKGHTTFRDDLV